MDVSVSSPKRGRISPVARVMLTVANATIKRNPYKPKPSAIMICPEMGPTPLRWMNSSRFIAGCGKSQIFATQEAYRIRNSQM